MVNKKLKYFFEVGFNSKSKKKNYLILALKYVNFFVVVNSGTIKFKIYFSGCKIIKVQHL